jgi:pimeloyl-ACP methyl ester carboxylesterase
MRQLGPALSTGLTAAARLTETTAQELGWVAARLALYPSGVRHRAPRLDDPRHRTDTLPPAVRALIVGDVEGHGRPIVLVHGFADNRSAFARLSRTLRRRGFGAVTTVNYSPITTDVRRAAEQLGRHVEAVCADSGYERVHVVGHSLGGVIARYYVQRLGGDDRVHTVVTLGSPHQGTQLARWAPVLAARHLRPSSPVIRELAEPARCRSRFVALWSDGDQVVLPHTHARIDHPDLDVTNVRIAGVGHVSLLMSRDAAQIVAQVLSGRAERPSFRDPTDVGDISVAVRDATTRAG